MLANIANPAFPFPPQFSSRKYAYYGGDLVAAPDNASDHIYDGAVYIEQLTPANQLPVQPNPIVLVHGAGGSGLVWLDTPDGRQGWADMFLYLGYTVFVVDMAYMGRSQPANWLKNSTFPTETQVANGFTAPEKAQLWPQANLHTQWPGNGLPGDPIFDTFYRLSTATPKPIYMKTHEQKMRLALTSLLKLIGRSTIIVHSMGALSGWQAADSVPELCSSLVLIAPLGPPFENVLEDSGATRGFGLTNSFINYDPPLTSGSDLQTERVGDGGPPGPDPGPTGHYSCLLQKSGTVKKLKNISQVKQLYVVGEADFVQTFANCTVQYLRQGGVTVDFMDLKEFGIRGNGHFVFMELNSRIIFGKVARWIFDTEASGTDVRVSIDTVDGVNFTSSVNGGISTS
ncbi:MAG: hypothetical protein M1814_004768 [Vezdaea aestivalis]|nr:MAG: hypothetical protein M1814_004768 [Vezdaea aestivalis]